MAQKLFYFCIFALAAFGDYAEASLDLDESIRTIDSLRNEVNIVGGERAYRGQFPYMIQMRFFGHYCGAAVIDKYWIITAAHCATAYPFDYTIVANQDNMLVPDGEERKYRVTKIIQHPNFDAWTKEYDIALMKVNREIEFDYFVQPVQLPEPMMEFEEGVEANATGWGAVWDDGPNSVYLQYVTLPVIDDEVCREAHQNYVDHMFCAGFMEGGKDTCQGDSGGPLVCNIDDDEFLCGIISFGRGCALPGYPGGYIKVSYFIDWIRASMAEEAEEP